MAAHSEIDANIVIEIALNKVIELQKQIILSEAKYISLRQDFDRLNVEYDSLKKKFESSTPTKTTNK